MHGLRGLLSLALVPVSLILPIATHQPVVSAHSGDLGWIWFWNSWDNEDVIDHTYNDSGWYNAIRERVFDWSYYTAITPHVVAQGSSGAEIHCYDGDYGNTGWYGYANVYSGSTYCNTGGCNKTNKKADYSAINLNNYYPQDYYQKRKTAGHELGHPFGLSHPPDCSVAAIMDTCSAHHYIADHDIWHISQLY